MGVSYRCWAEIDLNALRGNLAWIRHQAGDSVQVMTVVKADAYGHGLKSIAALLMQSGTDIFGVANLTEAKAIRSVGKGWPILLLGPALPDEIEPALREGVMLTVSSFDEAEAITAVAQKLKVTAQVQIKVDTGMGRLGIDPSSAPDLFRRMESLHSIRVSGIYTHFAAVEEDPAYSRKQRKSFAQCLASLGPAALKLPYIHANNSGGLLLEKESFFNTVRPGLLVYGVWPPGKRRIPPVWREKIQPALSWKTRVGFVKEVPAGSSLSYGRTFTAPRKMRVATLTAGYGDGFLRSGSNRAHVLIRGVNCPVVGRITMDQTLVDVSALERAEPGDEAVLIGRQGKESISASELASACETIPWEVLTAITYRVPRIYRGAAAA